MQNIGWKFVLILAVLGLCGTSMWFKEPRLGKDLQGGVSMIYAVSILPDEPNPQEILREIIDVLKQRVNPKGVFDISMEPLGRDRIEVIMPLPGPEVLELKKTFDEAIDSLKIGSEISTLALDEALATGTVIEKFDGNSDSKRGRLITSLSAAHDARADAQAEKAALPADADDDAKNAAAFKLARANIAFRDLRLEVLDLSLDESTLRRIVALPTETEVLIDPDTGEETEKASERQVQVDRAQQDFPGIATGIDEVVAAHDAYQKKRRGLDDPEDLKRLLRGAGVLEYHIAVRNSTPGGIDLDDLRQELIEKGPDSTTSTQARWFALNELDQWYDTDAEFAALQTDPVNYFSGGRDLVAGRAGGEYYLLLWTTPDRSLTHETDVPWKLKSASRGADSFGRAAVNFELDFAGAKQMSGLTSRNQQEPMAIVLDGEVYSAPIIQSTISRNGQITGSFTQKEINYLMRVLNAGSLSARLSPNPISTNTLGPTLGADNLKRGSGAFIAAIIAVAVFMLLYYFFAGFVANIALAANGVIIFGMMMAIDGTFTLPGLAGIVLTIGMAVDANVLIYERIREEIFEGELDLRGCIRQGYAKALSTILDGNITNLIVCFVLFYVATTEVKGFALTLTIGICATLFTALFVTRQIYHLYTDIFGAKKLVMLPTAIPAIHRALEPNVNWIGFRKVFWAFSIVAVIASLSLVATRGVDMLDTEFRGGVALTMTTVETGAPGERGPDEEPTRLLLSQADVERRIRGLADGAASAPDDITRLALAEFSEAAIQTMGDTTTGADGGVSSSQFQIKISNPKELGENETITRAVMDAILGEFGDQLDVDPVLTFAGANAGPAGRAYPIEADSLSEVINRPTASYDVTDQKNGLAIVLDEVEPAVTKDELESRIKRMRAQPDFALYATRTCRVFGLESANEAEKTFSSFCVVVHDEHRNYSKIDLDAWDREVVGPEWTLVSTALTQPASLENVSEYSSAVAETLKANATVAIALTLLGILVYIWVRFGSLRYSAAAIVALVHDVSLALGLLALSTIIGGTALGDALLIEPFRINLGVVAALLTIIGYSLNDTIVILDRIRENRGKLPLPTAPIVNRSINQTVSRTLLTSVTTLMAVLIMYAFGGSGIRAFTFCLLVGLLVGTYSSVAIAAPLVFTRKGPGASPSPSTASEGNGASESISPETAPV